MRNGAVRSYAFLRGGGFTLVELLLVVVLLGVLVIVGAPRLGPLLSGGQLRMGAREIASVGRYARTMALLNQTPVDLVIQQGTGRFSVQAREAQSATALGISDVAALTNAVGYTESLLETSARRRASLSGGFGLATSAEERESSEWRGRDSATNTLDILEAQSEDVVEATVSFEESINMKREVSGVKLWFEGYRDVVESRSAYSKVVGEGGSVPEGGEVVIRYRANGTVRPYTLFVRSEKDETDFMRVSVNSVGTVNITDREGN